MCRKIHAAASPAVGAGYTGSAYVWPCHGAQFSTSGQVLSGPAPSNLPTFSTSFASNVLTMGA